MTKNSYYNRNKLQRISDDADQTELNALKLASTPVSSGIGDDVIADSLDDFERNASFDVENWQTNSDKIEDAVGAVFEEIAKRIVMLGSLYPFKLVNGSLVYTESENLFYEFLLCVARSPNLTEGQYVNLPRNFEKTAALTCAKYLGQHAEYEHTGSPRDASVAFKDKFITINRRMSTNSSACEDFFWNPQYGLPANGPTSGDEGVDFIAWHNFSCGRRIGALTMLGQCACGDNWRDKYSDISLKKFGKWFGQMSVVDPVRAFAVPFVIVEPLLTEVSREAGLVFDRVRLVKLAHDLKLIDSNWIARFREAKELVLGS